MKYNHKKIEGRWQARWLADGIYEPDLDSPKKPFYNLMMFPYPSAEGLHIGNMYAFVGSDIYGRKKRMDGHDVFEPIGLDGFGIHSENYAIKIGRHPAEQARKSEENFYGQLAAIGNGFSWNERLETYDPEYYKWTQWIFIQMYNNGLAYRKSAKVNWCPKCATVLADEQVVAGKCERCDSDTVKKDLEQWFFKITDYAERLLNNLERLDWSENVKIAQRNWIGRSPGALVDFGIAGADWKITVFTTRPDTLFGATYVVLGPEHELLRETGAFADQITNFKEVKAYIKKAKAKSDGERIAEGKAKTGVMLEGAMAVNPANGDEIPIFVADYVLGNVGTGAIMAVPAHDERDFAFAKKFKLPVKKVIKPPDLVPSPPAGASAFGHLESHISTECWTGDGTLVNSGEFTGMDSANAKWEITKKVGGREQTNYHLRDWLISRQRYWGPPIPMIFCGACGKWFTEKEENLPVLLPDVKEFRPTGTDKSPLANFPEFYKTQCPECGGEANRETDVSDTFLDSAWYYLRYLDAANAHKPFSNVRSNEWLPVDMYIGGAEHAVLHLLYVRFVSMALHDMKILEFARESGGDPIKKFRAHGLIIKDGAKMSKSKGNVINPDEYLDVYGADALRMYLMFLGPFKDGGDFSDTGIRGITRFLEKVWSAGQKIHSAGSANSLRNDSEILHRTIRKVTDDIDNLRYNTAISALMVLLRGIEDSETFKIFLQLLAPFAPHITEELWEMLGETTSIHKSKWPAYDRSKIAEKSFTLIVQVNGRVRDAMEAPADITESEAERIARGSAKLSQYLDGKNVRKVIFVPGKLVNFVVS